MSQLFQPLLLPAGGVPFSPLGVLAGPNALAANLEAIKPVNGYTAAALAQSFAIVDSYRNVVGAVPIYESQQLAEMVGVKRVLAADLSNNPGGAYKIRGAINLISIETANTALADLSKWLITCFSHGNHSNGVGLAAQQIRERRGSIDGLPVLAVLPCQPQTSIRKIRMSLDRGDTVILHGQNITSAENLLKEAMQNGFASLAHYNIQVAEYTDATTDNEICTLLSKPGPFILRRKPLVKNWAQEWDNQYQRKLLVPTYDHLAVSLGQGTGFLDALSAGVSHFMGEGLKVVLGVGGAGFLAGMASAMQLMGIRGSITGVNRFELPVFGRSLFAGELNLDENELHRPEMNTVLDGVDVPNMGRVPMKQILELEKNNQGFIRAAHVSEAEVREVIALMAHHHVAWSGIPIFEGAALAPIAALLNGAVSVNRNDTVLVTLSGRNIDQRLIDESLRVYRPTVTDLDLFRRVRQARLRVRQENRSRVARSLPDWIQNLRREEASVNEINERVYDWLP